VRILHAIARLNVGGAAVQVLELAAEQRRAGHEVLVLHGRIPEGEESMTYLAAELGVPETFLPELQRPLSARADARAIRRIRHEVRAFRPDVLHTHAAKAGATGRAAALLAGRSRPRVLVHTFHGHVLRGYFGSRQERAFTLVERGLARRTDALVAVSAEVRDDLVSLGAAPAERFVVIPYGFDFSRLEGGDRARARGELGVDEGAFLVGFVGRLTAIKRPQDLVRAVAAVDGAVLVALGDGELRGEVEALASKLGVRLHVLGYRQDVPDWYAAADAVALASANEGTPVTAIEALAAGTPVVATRVGGVPAVVDDGETGFLAEAGDVDGLAEGLRRLAADPGLRARMGALGAARMRERFATGRMAADVERLYRSLGA
jgi:glycosyltransferase involved in cell wall biosynthesis